jgi:hypothetical protein
MAVDDTKALKDKITKLEKQVVIQSQQIASHIKQLRLMNHTIQGLEAALHNIQQKVSR